MLVRAVCQSKFIVVTRKDVGCSMEETMKEDEVFPLAKESLVGVVGAGTMGRGIALVAASAGHNVYLYDVDSVAVEKAIEQIGLDLDRMVKKGRLSNEDKKERLARISPVDALEGLSGAALVIEAILEKLDVKVALFSALESLVDSKAILATNTSSLSVTAIAAKLKRPEQFVGMHFFNPPMMMPLVEVVSGHATSAGIVQIIYETAKAWGKVPVLCKSTPGFIVNRVARPFYGESLRLVNEQAASPAVLDCICREAGAFRMGPFELMDLIGHDVNFAVTSTVYEEFYHDPRYKPSLVQKALVDAGWLGRKTGCGFYSYDGSVEQGDVASASSSVQPTSIVVEGDLGVARPLVERAKAAGIRVEQKAGAGKIKIGDAVLALTNGLTASELSASWNEQVVLFDLVHDFNSTVRIAIAPGDAVKADSLDNAVGFFQALGMAVSVIDDAPGLVVMRTVAMIINEAADVVQQGVANRQDVDLAMMKGVNYPLGPFQWMGVVGAKGVFNVIQNLGVIYGDDHYRPSPLLRRLAIADK